MLVALKNGSNLRYVHLDLLGSTSVVTNSSGAQYGYTRYYPYGSTRDSGGSLDTTKKFTGQRLDGTGLYYYGARYYDPSIGRFISPDTVVPNPANPQSFNRYSYCLNNPLRYTDPTGHYPQISWGEDAEGNPLPPPPSAFEPGGYYNGQYGVTIPYNSYTTVGGPDISNFFVNLGLTPSPTTPPIIATKTFPGGYSWTLASGFQGPVGAEGRIYWEIRVDYTNESLTVSIDTSIVISGNYGLINIKPNVFLYPSQNGGKVRLEKYSCLGRDTCWQGSSTIPLSITQPYLEVYVSAWDTYGQPNIAMRTRSFPPGYRINLVTGETSVIRY
jgi:RHS repeat-associated protein